VGLLVVTAVAVERDAVVAGLGGSAEVHAVGVGVAAAAAGTARLLAIGDYDAVVCAGIGGGFAGRVQVGGVVVGTVSVAADLGADSPSGFLSIEELGFGTGSLPAGLELPVPGAVRGPVLTVSTVTGTAEGLARILDRYPDAAAEAMEGFGVATAAAQAGIPFAELRTVSNPVGPRDRAAWRIPQALAALTDAARALSRLGA
jgi:futalosine hydrolase